MARVPENNANTALGRRIKQLRTMRVQLDLLVAEVSS